MLRMRKMLLMASCAGLLLQSGGCQMFADAFNTGWNLGNSLMGTDLESPFSSYGTP